MWNLLHGPTAFCECYNYGSFFYNLTNAFRSYVASSWIGLVQSENSNHLLRW